MERRGSICSSAHPRRSTGLECTYLGAVEFLQFTMELLSTACSFLLNDLFTKKDYIMKCQLKKDGKMKLFDIPFDCFNVPFANSNESNECNEQFFMPSRIQLRNEIGQNLAIYLR